MLAEKNKSINDFLNLLWADYQKNPERGVKADFVFQVLEELAGSEIREKFERMTSTTEDIDLEALCNKAGLGFEWDKVHAIAEELEHVSNQELIQKLDRFLNHPQTDPHGDPIPDGNGKMPVIHQLSMADVVEKKKVIVSSVGNQSPAILELLNHYHINIGTEIKINQRFSFDGSIEIKVGKYAACIISELVAKNIFVYHD